MLVNRLSAKLVIMSRDAQTLRRDALNIWHAGVEAVRPARLIAEFVAVDGHMLQVGDEELDLRSLDRIAVVGAGKAAAEMTLALEKVLGPQLLREKQVAGWVNVPADCIKPTQAVTLHAARPAHANEPTREALFGTERILDIVRGLGPRDLCFCVISGGGSALLPAPVDGLSLDDKIALTREMAARGSDIVKLNTVRRELSRVKGGGLAHACQAGRLVSLILSDVLGDDLSLVASGPTVRRAPTPAAAIEVLQSFDLLSHPAGRRAMDLLKSQPAPAASSPLPHEVINIVIGNNATAVDAAGVQAERLGYSHAMTSATAPEGAAEEVAHRLVQMAQTMRTHEGPDCLITGGEPTVTLCPIGERGVGGRNQQLALAALECLSDWRGMALVAAGTDGEDGPTDAAGAIVDEQIARAAQALALEPQEYLARNDAYHFFEQVDGLLKTGPTHTNVCDLRVVTVAR